MTVQPTFTVLTTPECHALLASQHVGRLAFTFRDRVDIEPVHYVFRDGRIWGRTQHGTKVHILAHHPWVAFEVDHVEALFTWRSVVVHGRVEFPDPEGPAVEQAQYHAGVTAFRTLVPDAFTENDPTPDRDIIFTIPAADVHGRAASTRRS